MSSGLKYLIEFAIVSIAAALALLSPAHGFPFGVMLWVLGRAMVRRQPMTGERALALAVMTALCLLSLAFQVPQGGFISYKINQATMAVASPLLAPESWAWIVLGIWLVAVWRLWRTYDIARWSLVKVCEKVVGGGENPSESAADSRGQA